MLRPSEEPLKFAHNPVAMWLTHRRFVLWVEHWAIRFLAIYKPIDLATAVTVVLLMFRLGWPEWLGAIVALPLLFPRHYGPRAINGWWPLFHDLCAIAAGLLITVVALNTRASDELAIYGVVMMISGGLRFFYYGQ